jgi:manganese transport protein
MAPTVPPQLETEPPISSERAANASYGVSASGRQLSTAPSLPEAHRTIPFSSGASWFRKVLSFAGPGYLVAVGYMDPGNWATDLLGGSKFAYSLLSVIALSSLMAMFLQALCAKLGIASGRDLAQACREHYSRPTTIFLWIICEIAIAACDLAEVLGSAVALKLLFGLPLLAGVIITAFDVLIVLALQGRGFRLIEAFVVTLIATIAGCFAYEIFFAQPLWRETLQGIIPRAEILRNRDMLYIAIGILGATVMPHNLYLHSSIVQTRAFGISVRDRREALRFAVFDSTVALAFALFVNAAILVLAAAAFHTRGLHNVAEIADAYKLLSPVLGVSLASTVFACALLASGQNSTLTGTLAGQIVMEGFLDIRLRPWVRRLITRVLAITPAVIVIGFAGEGKVTALIILSQVVLSFQLPFAIIPLIQFTGDRNKMGEFANSRFTAVIAWAVAIIILFFNAELLWLIFRST